jgi:hypothetical protein
MEINYFLIIILSRSCSFHFIPFSILITTLAQFSWLQILIIHPFIKYIIFSWFIIFVVANTSPWEM